ncbi:hypothetical protein BT69DRAFT_1351555 [Atractiella rhizophila]|nr:hypothetical protein BT69DRAFT_1351555 [Atractiella rhizophila]
MSPPTNGDSVGGLVRHSLTFWHLPESALRDDDESNKLQIAVTVEKESFWYSSQTLILISSAQLSIRPSPSNSTPSHNASEQLSIVFFSLAAF